MRQLLLTSILFSTLLFSNVSLTIESLKSQNEYVTTNSGIELLQCTLEIGITTDSDIPGFAMGIEQWYTFGLGLPYGGLVEEYDFTMSTLSGNTIYGGHNMFPQDYYIPAGTSNETLMYIPIVISETNDDQLCIRNTTFSDLDGNILTVDLDEESCISIDDICLDVDNDNLCDSSIDGDINLDNELDILDVIEMVNIALGAQDFDLAADLNEDRAVNVIDVVLLVNSILGLSRVNYDIDTKATLDESTLNLEGPIGGIQFTGNLISNLYGDDVMVSHNGKSIIYNLNGTLKTKVFTFEKAPNNLIVSSSSAQRVNVESTSPAAFMLNSAYPNPFNPTTTIDYDVSSISNLNISIYNTNGQLVDVLADRMHEPGQYSIVWNAQGYTSGVYFVKLIAGEFIATQKIMLIK